MKRNLLSLVAVVIAIALSSFSAKFGTIYYLVYTGGTNPHNVLTSYTSQTNQPAVDNGTDFLYWVSVEDINGTINIQSDEFNAAFPNLDVSTVDGNLNNEVERTTTYTLSPFGTGQTRLEKKF